MDLTNTHIVHVQNILKINKKSNNVITSSIHAYENKSLKEAVHVH